MSVEVDSKNPAVDDTSEPSSARLIVALSVAGLLSGLIMVGAYQVTLPRILANQAQALREAVLKVLPGAERFQAMAFIDGSLQPVEEDSGSETVYAGYDGQDRFVGYAIPGEGVGFQDAIKLIYGYEPGKKAIVGMEVLDSKETPGLGDKIIKDPAFKQNFTELAVEPEIVPVPTGTKSTANEIDTITGATISSKAVVNILNTTNARWLPRLSGPPAPAEPRAQGDTPPGKTVPQEEK